MSEETPRHTALILATLATKSEEVAFLEARLLGHGIDVTVVDLSLQAEGQVHGTFDKAAAINASAARVLDEVTAAMDAGVNTVVGMGGGTGAEIALKVLRALPITFPKVLITTLPFDPRYALADNSVVLVPTLADINGLNATLREILENAAAMTAGLCRTRRRANSCVLHPSIGITALGATDGAAVRLVSALKAAGKETTVFHANGFGGAAFTRFAERGAFSALIDMTPHELTRICIAGAHVPMPGRFTVGGDKPKIVLPGGLNFIGLGEKALVPDKFLSRPHYSHSGYFTHVKLTEDEMIEVTGHLADAINKGTGPRAVIVPMGGFSSQDCRGGAIEDPALREAFLETIRKEASSDVDVQVLQAHLTDADVTEAILNTLTDDVSPRQKVH